jgi:hypothetical protein
MKKILLSIIALCCSMAAGAQQTDQISAVLQVEGQTPQVFYGASALKSAIEAAPDKGGVITLSSGQFSPVTINKCVRIYGSGFQAIDSLDVYQTNISGDCTINIPEEIASPHDIVIEGVYFNKDLLIKSAVDGLTFIKSSVGVYYTSAPATRCGITQSYIRGNVIAHQMFIQNSWLGGRIIPFDDGSSIVIDHSILRAGEYFYNYNDRFTCRNSILWSNSRPSNQTYNFCVSPYNIAFNGNAGCSDNWYNVGESNVFKDANNADYTTDRTFELKSPETYIGNDGTQVGVHGGAFPWNKVPSTPVVKNLDAKVNGTSLGVTYQAEVRNQ